MHWNSRGAQAPGEFAFIEQRRTYLDARAGLQGAQQCICLRFSAGPQITGSDM